MTSRSPLAPFLVLLAPVVLTILMYIHAYDPAVVRLMYCYGLAIIGGT